MRKSIFLSAGAILIFIAGTLLYKNFNTESKKKLPGAPGWYKQYFEMKKNENGEIPRGALRNAYMQVASKRGTQSSLLTSVMELGPTNVGGRTRALLIDNSDANHLIAGGISGGVWNSYNRGGSWQQVDDFASTLSVSCITQDYFNPDIIYYGTGEGSGNSANIPGDGIFKSTDGGVTYNQLSSTSGSAFDYVWSVKADPSEQDVLFAGTTTGIFKSVNGGESFSGLGVGGEIQDIEILDNGTVFFTRNGVGVYKSVSGDSATFTKIVSTLPQTGIQRIEIATCKNSSNVIYAAFESGSGYDAIVSGIYKSVDTGATWVNVTSDFDNGGINFPWYCFIMAVHPSDPNVVYLGTQSLQYTTDGGASWQQAEYTHADYHSLIFDEDNSNQLYIGNDGGVWRFTDPYSPTGAENLNNGYNVTQFYAGTFFPYADNNDFFAGAQDNGTQARRNNNSGTVSIFGGDGAFTHVSQNNPNVSYVSYQNGEVSRATNTLSAFPSYSSVMSDPGEGTWFIHPFEIDPRNGNIVYYPTNKKLWRAKDGKTFQPITNNLSGGTPYAIGVSKGAATKTVYLGGGGGLFVRIDTADQAVPGNEVNLSSLVPFEVSNSFISCINVHPEKDSVCYLAMSNYSVQGRVWKVTDATTPFPTFVNISGDLPANLPVNWIEMDPENPDSILFIGTDIGLFSTANGGQNWTYENSIIPNVPIMQIRMRKEDRRLFVYTHGRGTWTGNIAINPSSVSDKTFSFNVNTYPNPAISYLNIELPEPASIEILNLSGKNVGSLKMIGNKQILNIAQLYPGIYFLKATLKNGQTAIKKFVKS